MRSSITWTGKVSFSCVINIEVVDSFFSSLVIFFLTGEPSIVDIVKLLGQLLNEPPRRMCYQQGEEANSHNHRHLVYVPKKGRTRGKTFFFPLP